MEHFTSLLVITASLSLHFPTSESLTFYITPSHHPSAIALSLQPSGLLCYESITAVKQGCEFNFYDGLHTLNHTLEFSRTKYVQLTALHHSSKVTIHCNKDILWLSSITYLRIVNLTVQGAPYTFFNVTPFLYEKL